MFLKKIVNLIIIMGLLMCKYAPFWQEVRVKYLIFKWPLRPVGLLFHFAQSFVHFIIFFREEYIENMSTYSGKKCIEWHFFVGRQVHFLWKGGSYEEWTAVQYLEHNSLLCQTLSRSAIICLLNLLDLRLTCQNNCRAKCYGTDNTVTHKATNHIRKSVDCYK